MFFNLFFSLIIFIFGLSVGSFLNSVIYRLHSGENFLFTRSYCPHCKHILSWQELIPILSFLILKGKCRYCHQKISWQYPLVEFFTATLFVLAITFPEFVRLNSAIAVLTRLYYLAIFCFLIVIFVYDLKHYLIPDKIIYPAITLTFFYQIFSSWGLSKTGEVQFLTNFYSPLLSAFGAAAFFLLIVLVSKGKWMGIGDIKLAFLMGLILGFSNILVALFSAFFGGAIIGLGLIMVGKKTLKSEIPFGPFLVTGTFIALFLGQTIINWYLDLL